MHVHAHAHCVCVCVCVYVSIYVRMYVCMYVLQLKAVAPSSVTTRKAHHVMTQETSNVRRRWYILVYQSLPEE
jgi:hypothetical protein